MCRAAAAQGVAPHRVSFMDAVRWLLSAGPDEALPDLIVNPDRPDRHEPRAINDRQDTYTKLSRPRKQMRKELRRQKVKA